MAIVVIVRRKQRASKQVNKEAHSWDYISIYCWVVATPSFPSHLIVTHYLELK